MSDRRATTPQISDLPLLRERLDDIGPAGLSWSQVLQSGKFGSGDGRYAYLDLRKDLKAIVEIEEIDVPYQDGLEAAKALLAGDQAEDLAGSRLADQPAR